MGTRSFIALRSTDGTITAVYCHWDGYLEHNGRLLLEHYADVAKLGKLISLGGVSILGPEIGSRHDFDERPSGQTTFYARDRGDPLLGNTARSLDDLLDVAAACGAEYVYILDCTFPGGPEWYYAQRGMQFFGGDDGAPFSKLRPLAPVLVESASQD